MKRFRFDYARFAPFLLAKGRRVVHEATKDNLNNILRINTDGFLTTKKIDSLDVGDKVIKTTFTPEPEDEIDKYIKQMNDFRQCAYNVLSPIGLYVNGTLNPFNSQSKFHWIGLTLALVQFLTVIILIV